MRIARAQVSGVEWVIGIHSSENGPMERVLPGSISIRGDGNTPPRLRVLYRSTAAAKGVAYTGHPSVSHKYGNAPK